jgi:hypothetical protein
MSAIPFDVFAFTHSLVDSGIPNNQADTIAQAVSKAIQESNASVIEQTKITIEHFKSEYKLDDVATNKSLDSRATETELKLDARIKETELKIAESKAELVRWVIGAGFLQVTLIAALLLRLTGKA